MSDNKKSIYSTDVVKASKIATFIFLALVVCADIFGYVICKYVLYVWADNFSKTALILTTVIYYICSIMGTAILLSVLGLLNNISKDIVFEKKNTKLMGIVVVSLIVIGVLCVVETFFWPGAFFLSIMSWFMSLVVLCVKLVFDKAIAMKNELDLTI